MKTYIGVKVLQAQPMTRGEYNMHRGWVLPKDENPDDKGYLVVYRDGYQSWSPDTVFEASYREIPAHKVADAGSFAAEFLKAIPGRYSQRQPVFQGLSGKRYESMIAMLEDKKTVAEVAECFEVNPDFVAAELKKLKDTRKPKGK